MTEAWHVLGETAIASRYAWPAQRWKRLSMVIGSDGGHTGPDGTSHSMTSEHDRWLVRAIRRDAQTVIVGAASVRSEGWFLPPEGSLHVISRSASLPAHCPDPSRVHLSTWTALDAQTQHRTRVLCEGGARVAHELAEQNFFDELCLTFPLTPEDPILPAWLHGDAVWTCVSDIQDTTHRFTIWRRGNE